MADMQNITRKSGDQPATAKVLFFGRDKCDGTNAAIDLLRELDFEITLIKSGSRGEKLPEEVRFWQGEYILCYRSLFILPEHLLNCARIAAINFHPAPPEYPGSGCLNFALYDESKHYGVTAHIMNEKVDNGQILEVRRFPIVAADTVDSLLQTTHGKLLDQFCGFVTNLAAGGEAFVEECRQNSNDECWRGDARTMQEFEALKVINKDISKAELDRVIRATYTKLYPPKIVLHGYEFSLSDPN
ncbi:MAG: hypothetical protein GY947_22600 [Rhodobacteraceae bacterium]|nr:hypothetical protein [Paracoccaceae bacterium]